jgi:hypothetical protein
MDTLEKIIGFLIVIIILLIYYIIYLKRTAITTVKDSTAVTHVVTSIAPVASKIIYPAYLGYTTNEQAFCIAANLSASKCSNIVPYLLDVDDAKIKYNTMLNLAKSRNHKYFAIAGIYGFTFNDFDHSQIVNDANYICRDDASKQCGCNDNNCINNYIRRWAVYQLY